MKKLAASPFHALCAAVVFVPTALTLSCRAQPDAYTHSITPRLSWLSERLHTSSDPDELVQACEEICESDSKDAMAALSNFLVTPDSWNKLDLIDQEHHAWHKLRIYRILLRVAERSDSQAQQILECLLANDEFAALYPRLEALIEACGSFKNAKGKIVDLMTKFATPGGFYDSLALPALVKMSSDATVIEVEKRLRNNEMSNAAKKSLFLNDILKVRDAPAILGLYRHLFEHPLSDAQLMNTVVLSLFDYQAEWYPQPGYGGSLPKPPHREDAPEATINTLVELSATAEKLDFISPETRQAVLREQKRLLNIKQGE
jgi:hypothetical protein